MAWLTADQRRSRNGGPTVSARHVLAAAPVALARTQQAQPAFPAAQAIQVKPDDNEDKFLTAHLPDGLRLSLGPHSSRPAQKLASHGPGTASTCLRATLGRIWTSLSQVALALSQLHSIV